MEGRFPDWEGQGPANPAFENIDVAELPDVVQDDCRRKCPRVYGRLKIAIRGGAVAQLGARLDGIEEVVGSNPIGSTNVFIINYLQAAYRY